MNESDPSHVPDDGQARVSLPKAPYAQPMMVTDSDETVGKLVLHLTSYASSHAAQAPRVGHVRRMAMDYILQLLSC
jgi:hypothetical protein